MRHYPMRFQSILKEQVWGGQRLADLFRLDFTSESKIGEVWTIVDRPQECSVITNGPFAGSSLHELCVRFGPELLGPNAPSTDRFPLIIKLLDPNDRLSVQVHPTASYVKNHPEAEAVKNEAWYVAYAEPGAKIIHGLREGVNVNTLRTALGEDTIAPLLQAVPVQDGRLYYIPSGLIHALLPGSIMIEVQQNSDTTFRLYDWDRPGLDGKPRALHVTEGLESAEDFLNNPSLARHSELGPLTLTDGIERARGLLCPWFQIEDIRVRPGSRTLQLDPASFTILVGVRGRLDTTCPEGPPITASLKAGDSVLVPAGPEQIQLATQEAATMLKVTLPRPDETTG